MTNKKFENEVNTLKCFFTEYCKDKHSKQNHYDHTLQYKQKNLPIELNLCDQCHELISYAFEKLHDCPHEEKPRCRNCPNPCYEKPQWKQLSRIMRYSSFKLGIKKIKNKISNLIQ